MEASGPDSGYTPLSTYGLSLRHRLQWMSDKEKQKFFTGSILGVENWMLLSLIIKIRKIPPIGLILC
jgi:hypothetical protein